jgi:class 3 adenylate cyclase/HAMP domain-containing protein
MKRSNPRRFSKVPLQIVLVVPFVLQIFAVVGLVGYLSFRNGQKAVNDLATELSSRITERINQHLQNYLNTPHLLQKVTASAIRNENLKLENFTNLERQFWSDIQLSDAVDYIFFGDEEGNFIGVQRYQDGRTVVKFRDLSTAPKRAIYELDEQGDRTKFIKSQDYDPRSRYWYKETLKTQAQTWSSIEISADLGVLQITPATPIYDRKGNLRGVLGTNLILSQISDFLRGLKISQSGKAFIIERSSDLVASSTKEPQLITKDKEPVRLKASNSSEPAVKFTMKHLLEKVGNLKQINSTQHFTFAINGRKQLVQVTPIQNVKGLDWLIIVIIPEDDFMAQINANTRNTILLCIAALGLAILLGIFTSRWISKPILKLSQASEQIASGELEQAVEVKGIKELEVLAGSFNSMAHQLKESFAALEAKNADLEKAKEELAEAKDQLEAVLNAVPGSISWIRSDGLYLGVNQHLAESLNLPLDEIIGQEVGFMGGNSAFAEFMHQFMASSQKAASQVIEVPVDNSVRYYLIAAQKYQQGTATVSVGIDITERKRAEEALQRANEELERRVEERTAELRKEKEKSERLLLNILPKPIAEQLKQQSYPAQYFDEATILFADIVGFTALSSRLEPLELVELLNQIFSAFDLLADKYGLEKIKTIGDAYMVVGGLPIYREDHAEAIADLALEMQDAIAHFSNDVGESFQIRIGINTGPVIAGVIGLRKFIYDLWGDTVNVASRMESHGLPGNIQVTAIAYERLKDKYVFEKRGVIYVKGKGEMITYWLAGKQLTDSPH